MIKSGNEERTKVEYQIRVQRIDSTSWQAEYSPYAKSNVVYT